MVPAALGVTIEQGARKALAKRQKAEGANERLSFIADGRHKRSALRSVQIQRPLPIGVPDGAQPHMRWLFVVGALCGGRAADRGGNGGQGGGHLRWL